MNAETRQWMDFAHELADVAREILLQAMNMDRDVEIKSDSSMVTEVDRRIESEMRSRIEDRYPSHGILGEEHGARNEQADLVWVLDPIDGTAPFVAGIPVFGTLIGLAREGQPFLGIIEHPATTERWCGVSGSGALRNGREVSARRCGDLSTVLMTNSNPDFLDAREHRGFARLRDRVRYTQYGGSCYAYAMLASGRTDVAIDSGMESFDLFAPAAVILGAGGQVTDWSGSPLTLEWSGNVLASGDPRRHTEALEILEASMAGDTG